MFTRKPRLSSKQPIDAAARPLPKLDTTPPVTKTYFADIAATSELECADWTYLVGTIKYGRVSNPKKAKNPTGPCKNLYEIRFSWLKLFAFFQFALAGSFGRDPATMPIATPPLANSNRPPYHPVVRSPA
jgi:hypothetical protein